jgi:hypothetical protein
MSLYEVSDIVGGVSFLARDLVRGGDPVRGFERSATRSLSQWDRIAARVVTVLGKTQITGSVLPFSHQLAEEALASIERVRKKARAEAVKLARSFVRNVDDSAFGLVAGVDEVLAGSAFMSVVPTPLSCRLSRDSCSPNERVKPHILRYLTAPEDIPKGYNNPSTWGNAASV